jgi:DNA polymerase
LKTLVVDFETAWHSKDGYTLSKMTTEEYIRDPRFKAWGLCVHEFGSDAPIEWVPGAGIQEWVDSVDWGSTAVCAHNAMFDVAILSWVYGANPARIVDTLSMARARRGAEAGNSLAKLAQEFGLPEKGRAVHSTDGYLYELPPSIEQELADYCKHDVFLATRVLERLLAADGGFPAKELRLIDMTLKMFTQPRLRLDASLLQGAIEAERAQREALLHKLAIEESDLASNDKFAELLRSLGVEPPTKISKTTGKEAYALAKNDALFQALLNGDREDVAMLCEARLKVKSTLERTRAQRFHDIALRGALPVPLSYYAARTGRWGGTQKINLQNLKRGSKLRDAIMAPEGHTMVVGDLAQIEPRVLAWMAGDEDLLNIFRSGEDAYALFGRRMFSKPNLTKESDPVLRQSAKSALIGAGYQMGWAAFAAQLLTGFLGAPPLRYTKEDAKVLGVTATAAAAFLKREESIKRMEDIPHTCTAEELVLHCLAAKAIIDRYRAAAQPTVDFWEANQEMLARCLYGGEEVAYKCLTFRKGEIMMPNGMPIRYPQLRVEKDDKGKPQFVYGPHATKIYAGKIVENCVQGLARIVMTDGMLRVSKRYPVVGTVHDEQIVLVPDAEVDEATAWIRQQMTTVPTWMPGIPLAASVDSGKRYGDAK